MDPIGKFYAVLDVLIREATGTTGNGIILAENAIDEHLAFFSDDNRRTGALHILETHLGRQLQTASPIQGSFIQVVADYAEKKLREIKDRTIALDA